LKITNYADLVVAYPFNYELRKACGTATLRAQRGVILGLIIARRIFLLAILAPDKFRAVSPTCKAANLLMMKIHNPTNADKAQEVIRFNFKNDTNTLVVARQCPYMST
jgi:hypothetical protein